MVEHLTRRSQYLRTTVVGMVSATLVTCSVANDSARPRVGVTLLTEAHVFYQDLKRGLLEAADSLEIDLQIVAGEWDLARQTQQVQNFLTLNLDAIVIAPVNSSGIVSAITEANDVGIPVFTADISADAGDVVSHIASDNVQGGRLLGEFVADRLNGRGNIAILDQPTVASVRDRVAGFREALEAFPDMRIVAAPAVERGLRDVAKQKTDNLLSGSIDVDAIFGSNDDCALGALASLSAAGRTDVIVVGYDATPEARTAIASGTMLVADAVQDPVEIGKRTIQAVAAYLQDGSVAPMVAVPVSIVTKDSLEAR